MNGNSGFSLTVLVMYISFWVVYACTYVGDIPECDGAYTWRLPVDMFFVILAPAVLGYFVGKGGNKEDTKDELE